MPERGFGPSDKPRRFHRLYHPEVSLLFREILLSKPISRTFPRFMSSLMFGPSSDVYRSTMASADSPPFQGNNGVSQGKINRLNPHSCRIYSHRLLMDTDFAVRGPLVQLVTASLSGFCSSGHGLALRFLQTLPHGNALAVCLYFTSIRLYRELSSPDGQSCLAHRAKNSCHDLSIMAKTVGLRVTLPLGYFPHSM